MKRFHKQRKKIFLTADWFLVIIGILLGTVFVFGTLYWNSPFSKEEAVYSEAEFSSYNILSVGRTSAAKEIRINFVDHEPLFIDRTCCTESVRDKMAHIVPGTVLYMYVHPHADTLLEIRDGSAVILSFDDSVEKLSSDIPWFLCLGILMYLAAVYGIFKLIKKGAD